MTTRKRGQGPWWVTDLVVPLVILVMFVLVIGLVGSLTGGPTQ